MKTEAPSASTESHFLTISQRTRRPENRVFRKKLQSIMAIKCVYIFSNEWDFVVQ